MIASQVTACSRLRNLPQIAFIATAVLCAMAAAGYGMYLTWSTIFLLLFIAYCLLLTWGPSRHGAALAAVIAYALLAVDCAWLMEYSLSCYHDDPGRYLALFDWARLPHLPGTAAGHDIPAQERPQLGRLLHRIVSVHVSAAAAVTILLMALLPRRIFPAAETAGDPAPMAGHSELRIFGGIFFCTAGGLLCHGLMDNMLYNPGRPFDLGVIHEYAAIQFLCAIGLPILLRLLWGLLRRPPAVGPVTS